VRQSWIKLLLQWSQRENVLSHFAHCAGVDSHQISRKVTLHFELMHFGRI